MARELGSLFLLETHDFSACPPDQSGMKLDASGPTIHLNGRGKHAMELAVHWCHLWWI